MDPVFASNQAALHSTRSEHCKDKTELRTNQRAGQTTSNRQKLPRNVIIRALSENRLNATRRRPARPRSNKAAAAFAALQGVEKLPIFGRQVHGIEQVGAQAIGALQAAFATPASHGCVVSR